MINLVYQFATRPSTVQIFKYIAATKIKNLELTFLAASRILFVECLLLLRDLNLLDPLKTVLLNGN